MQTNIQKTRFFGIDILRILMCLVVVFIHFTPRRDHAFFPLEEIQKFYSLAVPVFFIISFFLLSEKLANSNSLLWHRIKRLVAPQLFWTVILFVGFYILYNTGISDKEITVKSFFDQLIFGCSFNFPMWYVIETILATIVFLFLYKYFRKYLVTISVVCIIACFVLQYSGVNFRVFGKLPSEYCYTLGRFCEMMPYAFGGYLCFRAYDAGFKKYGRYLALPLIVLIHYNYALPWLDAGASFCYAGIRYFFEAILTLFVFLDINPNTGKIKPIERGIKILSSLTFGIYILHMFIGTIIKHYSNICFPEMDNIYVSIFTFIASALICFILLKIPTKHKFFLQ